MSLSPELGPAETRAPGNMQLQFCVSNAGFVPKSQCLCRPLHFGDEGLERASFVDRLSPVLLDHRLVARHVGPEISNGQW